MVIIGSLYFDLAFGVLINPLWWNQGERKKKSLMLFYFKMIIICVYIIYNCIWNMKKTYIFTSDLKQWAIKNICLKYCWENSTVI